MGYNFLPVDRRQDFLMPPSLADWLPADHLVWFVIEAVGQMDLSAFIEVHRQDGWGRAAYDPAMMVTLLLYAYCIGERSSRAIERRCREDVAFRVLTANRPPDHATIARFRAEHDKELAELFNEVLEICREAGLLKLGVVAIDGTKMGANASLAANRSAGGIEKEPARILQEAADADAAGPDDDESADRVPQALADPTARRARLRAAKARVAGGDPSQLRLTEGEADPSDRPPSPHRPAMRSPRGVRIGARWRQAGPKAPCGGDPRARKPALPPARRQVLPRRAGSTGQVRLRGKAPAARSPHR